MPFDRQAAIDWIKGQIQPYDSAKAGTVTPDQSYADSYTGVVTGSFTLDDPSAWATERLSPPEVTSHDPTQFADPIPQGTLIEGTADLSDEPESFADLGIYCPIINVQPDPLPAGDQCSGQITGEVSGAPYDDGTHKVEVYLETDQYYLQERVSVGTDGSWSYNCDGDGPGTYRFILVDSGNNPVGTEPEWRRWREGFHITDKDLEVYVETDQDYLQDTVEVFLDTQGDPYWRWTANGNSGTLILQLIGGGSDIGLRWRPRYNGEDHYPNVRMAAYTVSDTEYLQDTDYALVGGEWKMEYTNTGSKLIRLEDIS